MKTKEIKLYKFEELKPEIQEKVLDKFRERNEENFDVDFLIEDFIEVVKEELNLEIDKNTLNYSMFSRDNSFYIESGELLKVLRNKYNNLEDLDIPSIFGVYTNYLGGGLSSGLMRSEFNNDCAIFEEDEDKTEEDIFKEVIFSKNIYNDLNKLQDIMEQTYKGFYEEFNYVTTDECIKENIEANDYYFNEKGEIENE